MVLVLFIMKIGMAHACANHDLIKQLSANEQTVQLDKGDVSKTLSVEKAGPDPSKHTLGNCPDCNCHHAAAMLPLVPNLALYPTRTQNFSSATFFQQLATRSSFRPPIL
jgi:hypothetical protein